MAQRVGLHCTRHQQRPKSQRSIFNTYASVTFSTFFCRFSCSSVCVSHAVFLFFVHLHTDAKLPEKKILILYGPPGTGKTTLAHVLAKQAGYQPAEINASDERSTAGLKNRCTIQLFFTHSHHPCISFSLSRSLSFSLSHSLSLSLALPLCFTCFSPFLSASSLSVSLCLSLALAFSLSLHLCLCAGSMH